MVASIGELFSLHRASKDTSSYNKARTWEMSEKTLEKKSLWDADLVRSPVAVLKCHDQKQLWRGFTWVYHQSQSTTLRNQTRNSDRNKGRNHEGRPPTALLCGSRNHEGGCLQPSSPRPMLVYIITPDHLPRDGTGTVSGALPHRSAVKETASTEMPTSRSEGFNPSADAPSDRTLLCRAGS